MEGLKYPPLDLVPYSSERFAAYLAQAAAQAAHGKRAEAEEMEAPIRRGRRPKFAVPFTHGAAAEPIRYV
jgi:hypothetical protein